MFKEEILVDGPEVRQRTEQGVSRRALVAGLVVAAAAGKAAASVDPLEEVARHAAALAAAMELAYGVECNVKINHSRRYVAVFGDLS